MLFFEVMKQSPANEPRFEKTGRSLRPEALLEPERLVGMHAMRIGIGHAMPCLLAWTEYRVVCGSPEYYYNRIESETVIYYTE